MSDITKINIRNKEFNIKDEYAREQLEGKQDKLVAGEGINIEGNVISSNGGSGSGVIEVEKLPHFANVVNRIAVPETGWDYANDNFLINPIHTRRNIYLNTSLTTEEVCAEIKRLYAKWEAIYGEGTVDGYSIGGATHIPNNVHEDFFIEFYMTGDNDARIDISYNGRDVCAFDSSTGGWQKGFTGVIETKQCDLFNSFIYWIENGDEDLYGKYGYVSKNEDITNLIFTTDGTYKEGFDPNAIYKLVENKIGTPAIGLHKYNNRLYLNTSLSREEVKEAILRYVNVMYPELSEDYMNPIDFPLFVMTSVEPDNPEAYAGTVPYCILMCTYVPSVNAVMLVNGKDPSSLPYFVDGPDEVLNNIGIPFAGWNPEFNGCIEIAPWDKGYFPTTIRDNSDSGHNRFNLSLLHLISDLISYTPYTDTPEKVEIGKYFFNTNTLLFELIKEEKVFNYFENREIVVPNSYPIVACRVVKTNERGEIVRDFGIFLTTNMVSSAQSANSPLIYDINVVMSIIKDLKRDNVKYIGICDSANFGVFVLPPFMCPSILQDMQVQEDGYTSETFFAYKSLELVNAQGTITISSDFGTKTFSNLCIYAPYPGLYPNGNSTDLSNYLWTLYSYKNIN